jgi:FkbH-like protein
MEQPPVPPFRIAIGASFTAEPLRAALQFWGRELNRGFELRFAPYNQILQSLLDPASEFARNTHGVNMALLRYEDLGQFQDLDAAALARLESNMAELAAALRAAPARLSEPLIVCLCPSAPSLLENASFAASLTRARSTLEHSLSGAPGLQYLDDLEIGRVYPVDNWYDAGAERAGRIPYTELYFAALGTALIRRTQAMYMPPFKVIAVDCDNTLWLGICGEDGPAGVSLDPARRRLHEFLLRQRDDGMILALASKNNQQDVFDTFAAHPEFPLQLSHFAAWRLDWSSKAANLAALSAELNVGLDTLLFLDDNPKECAEVAEGAPDALPLALPENIDDLPEFLDHVWAFDHLVVTEEDRQRGAMMAQTLEFGREVRKAASLEEFIAGLNLRVDIQPMAHERLGRVAQLTQRTNQFNCTTIRRSEAELQALLAEGRHEIFTAEVADRFGEYGLVGVLIVERREGELAVDTFLLSCRALGRGVEHRMLSALAEHALDHGIYSVTVRFRETAKNLPAAQFLRSVAADSVMPRDDSSVYKFRATGLQALRWRPGSEAVPAPVAKPRGPSGAAHRFVPFEQIARHLRTPVQILTAIRKQAQVALRPSNAPDAPATGVEMRLAAIWTELLRKPVVSNTANFFDLGGHSLLAVLLLMRVKEEFAIELAVDDVYSGSLTLGDLARAIEARQLGEIDPDEYHALLAEIEGLSDEEVRALLEEEEQAGADGGGR